MRKGGNTMKKIYSAPEIEIILFDAEDVITNSLTEPELPRTGE